MKSSPILESVRQYVRKNVSHLDDDRYFAPDIEMSKLLIWSQALPIEDLPGVA
jgi:histidine ammonia-lyase